MKTLIVFAKAPQSGRVKTRLVDTTPLNDEEAIELYRAFLSDTLTMATMTSAETIAVHFTPPEEERPMRKLLASLRLGARNERRFVFAPQRGETFTERVAQSFKLAREFGGQTLAMVGSDSPLLKPHVVDEAFDFIYSHSGMALGPSGEGGVYFIGFVADAPIDFDGVFTEGSEIENLLAIAKACNMPLKVLPETLDVDVASDLIGLIGVVRAMDYERKFVTEFFPAHTVRAVKKLHLNITRGGAGDSRGKELERIDE